MIKRLYQIVEDQYFSSGDFNGMPIYRLEDDFDINGDGFRAMLRKAIEDDILTVRFHGNTHIRAFSKISKDKILEGFDKIGFQALNIHQNSTIDRVSL